MDIFERKDLLKLAAPLAAANPAAFHSEQRAREVLIDLWEGMKDRHTEAVTTGGVLIRRGDEDGSLEVWVTPSILGWMKK